LMIFLARSLPCHSAYPLSSTSLDDIVFRMARERHARDLYCPACQP
jgi:hypothetical protein